MTRTPRGITSHFEPTETCVRPDCRFKQVVSKWGSKSRTSGEAYANGPTGRTNKLLGTDNPKTQKADGSSVSTSPIQDANRTKKSQRAWCPGVGKQTGQAGCPHMAAASMVAGWAVWKLPGLENPQGVPTTGLRGRHAPN